MKASLHPLGFKGNLESLSFALRNECKVHGAPPFFILQPKLGQNMQKATHLNLGALTLLFIVERRLTGPKACRALAQPIGRP